MNELVSIIIVNYNGADYIEECLESVYAQTYQPVEIIVVDNHSSDHSLRILEHHAGRIRLIKSNINLGFAAGNNKGIGISKGTYVALLNNDAIAEPVWIARMVETMQADRSLGSCGCKIVSYFDRSKMDSAGLKFSAEGMSRGEGRNQSVDLYRESNPILIPSGCASMFRKEALNQTGLFDEDFFCYCEDADLGLRLQLYGWASQYVADAVVYHRYSETAGKYSSFKAYHVERNHYWFVLKNYPLKYCLLNPLYTFNRYLFQARSLMKRNGATAEYAKSVRLHTVVVFLLKAHLDAWRNIPKILKKRRQIQRNKRVSTKTFEGWLKKYSMSLQEMFEE